VSRVGAHVARGALDALRAHRAAAWGLLRAADAWHAVEARSTVAGEAAGFAALRQQELAALHARDLVRRVRRHQRRCRASPGQAEAEREREQGRPHGLGRRPADQAQTQGQRVGQLA